MNTFVPCSTFSEVISEKTGNPVLTFRFDQEAAAALLDQLQSAAANPRGAVVVATFGKRGNQKYPTGAVMIRAKEEQKKFAFEKKFRAKADNGPSYTG